MNEYYSDGNEVERLTMGYGRLELYRTQDILLRHLPAPPAKILDVGGGAGVHSFFLADRGYSVTMIDAVDRHVEQAQAQSAARPADRQIEARVGDARSLDLPDSSVDSVLLLGPLYHLTEKSDRVIALEEAARVLRPNGKLFAAAISRFAFTLDGVDSGHSKDPEDEALIARSLDHGHWSNPTRRPGWFTSAHLHRPEELQHEAEKAGFTCDAVLPVEGPFGLMTLSPDWLDDPELRERLLRVIRQLECEPTLIGATGHLMAIATRPPD